MGLPVDKWVYGSGNGWIDAMELLSWSFLCSCDYINYLYMASLSFPLLFCFRAILLDA